MRCRRGRFTTDSTTIVITPPPGGTNWICPGPESSTIRTIPKLFSYVKRK